MKSFICYVTLLLFGASLLANSRSTANESSITSNSLVVAETTSSEEFIARGTEPFWSVTVSKKGIVYSSPDTKQQTFSYVAPLKAEARRADLVRVYRLQGKRNNILIIKKVDACSDGMSDKEYPYSAIFILGNKVLEGCAEKKWCPICKFSLYRQGIHAAFARAQNCAVDKRILQLYYWYKSQLQILQAFNDKQILLNH